jgi:hypothetical protein
MAKTIAYLAVADPCAYEVKTRVIAPKIFSAEACSQASASQVFQSSRHPLRETAA